MTTCSPNKVTFLNIKPIYLPDVEDITGEDVAKLHDDFTIGLITCWMF